MRSLLLALLLFIAPIFSLDAKPQDIHTSPDIVRIHGDTDSLALPPAPPLTPALQAMADSIRGVYVYPLDNTHYYAVLMTRDRHVIIMGIDTERHTRALIAGGNWRIAGLAQLHDSTGTVVRTFDLLRIEWVRPPGNALVAFGVMPGGPYKNQKVLIISNGTIAVYSDSLTNANSETSP